MADHTDDLVASKTEGFKVGEKKTIDEYKQLGMSMSMSSSANSTWFLHVFTSFPLTTLFSPCFIHP